MAAVIRHIFPGENPDMLDDETFIERYREAVWIIKTLKQI